MFNSPFISRIRQHHGKGFVSPTETLSASTLGALRGLAIDAGLTPVQAEAARPTDLVRIYTTACSANFHLTREVAQRMGTMIDKLGGVMLPDLAPPPTPPASPNTPSVIPDAGDWIIDPPAPAATDLTPILAMLETLKREIVCQAGRIAAQEAEMDALRQSRHITLEVITPHNPAMPILLENTHPILPEVIDWLSLGINVFVYGPRGSGKTTLGEQVAKALDCPLYATGPIKLISRLVGYVNPFDGTYHGTDFRKCFEHGGLFLADEVSAGDEEVLLELNMALANSYYAFPDGIVQKHPDFRFFGGDNTDGSGATDEYNGRNKLDDSFMDRFALLQMGYDEVMERAIAPHKSWADHVQRFRAIATREGCRQPSPRATIFGGKWLNAGKSWEQAEAALLYRGMEETELNRMRSLMGAN